MFFDDIDLLSFGKHDFSILSQLSDFVKFFEGVSSFLRKHAIKFPSVKFALALGLARSLHTCFKEALGGEKARCPQGLFRRERRGRLPLEQAKPGPEKHVRREHPARLACETVFFRKLLTPHITLMCDRSGKMSI
jgi:hypothetical protein